MKLLIVESPSKAKTIEKYLDDGSVSKADRFTVRASVGHVRDLPKSNKQAIDIEGGFIPHYEISKGKEKIVYELQGLAEKLFEKFGHDKYYDIAIKLEEVIEEKLSHKGIYPNVDFYSGLVYRKMGIPTDLFTPVFAIARVAGWLAHWKEQLHENRIYRPTQIYTGEHGLPFIPIQERS